MRNIVLLLLLINVIQSCAEKVKVYLIANNYEGPLILIEDTLSNQQVTVKNDTMIFDFTKTNILRLNGTFIEDSQSLSSIKYYYVDSNGLKTEIPSLTMKNNNEKGKYIYFAYTRLYNNSQCDIISSKKNRDSILNVQEYFCDSLFSIRP